MREDVLTIILKNAGPVRLVFSMVCRMNSCPINIRNILQEREVDALKAKERRLPQCFQGFRRFSPFRVFTISVPKTYLHVFGRQKYSLYSVFYFAI